MSPLLRQVLLLISLALFVLMVTLTVQCNQDAFRAMAFHSRDFPYFLQFGVRFLDTAHSSTFNINPSGVSFLGFYGQEAVKSVHQGIHFEPLKYLDAVVLVLFGSPTAVFIERAALTFLPLPYLAWALPHRHRRDALFVSLVLIAYASLPSVLANATFDLRPFQLLAPLLVMASVAVGLQRPALEQILLFNLMFIAREEALIFGVVLIGVAFVQHRLNRKWRPAPLYALILSWAIWAGVIALYYFWTGYANKGLSASQAINDGRGSFNIPSLIPLIAILVVLALYALWLRRPSIAHRFDDVATYSLLLIPLGWQFHATFRYVEPSTSAIAFVFDARSVLWHYTLLVICILVWDRLATARAHWWLAGSIVGVIGASLAATLLHPASAWAEWRTHQQERPNAEPVWAVQAATDPHITSLLTDRSSFVPFYNYDRAYLYESLPAHIVATEARAEPYNEPYLQQLLEDEIEFVIFSRSNRSELQAILDHSVVRDRLIFVRDNGRFTIYQIPRPNRPLLPTLTPVDFGEQIRIGAVQIDRTRLAPGDTLHLTLPLQRIGAIEQDYNILVQVLDAAGQEWWRQEGWPWGAPTSNWDRWEIRPDGYTIAMPADAAPGTYRVMVRFYDPTTFEPLTAQPVAQPAAPDWQATTFEVVAEQ